MGLKVFSKHYHILSSFVLTQPIISFYQMQAHSVSLKSRLQPYFSTMLRHNPELRADGRKISVPTPHPWPLRGREQSYNLWITIVRFLQGWTIYWTSGWGLRTEVSVLSCPLHPNFVG